MKMTHTSTALCLRRLTLPLLAVVLLVLGMSGPVRAAAQPEVPHPASPSRALQRHVPLVGAYVPILDGAIARNSSHVDLYWSEAYYGTYAMPWDSGSWSNYVGYFEGDSASAPSAVAQDQVGATIFSATNYGRIVFPPDRTLPGFTTVSAPAAVSWGGSRLDVIAWGTPFNIPVLLHDASNDNGATWTWDGLPYLMNADPTLQPTIVSRGVNSLDILALGTDHALYYLNWNGSTWGQWQSLGGYLLYGHVVALPMSATQLEVYGIGSDGALYRQVLTDGRLWSAWSGWQNLGGYLRASPTVVAWGGSNRTVCALGGDNALWCQNGYGTPTTTWGGWYSLGGVFAPSLPDFWGNAIALRPVSVAVDAFTLMVFAVDANEECWVNKGTSYFIPGSAHANILWHGWQSLGII